MKFSQPHADLYVPEANGPLAPAAALARTTHLCVLAHQDDIEINAYPAVAECFGRADRHLTGVIVSDGAGSARAGPYAHYTDEEMKAVRAEEQRAAARLGGYNLQIQLAHPSSAVKAASGPAADAVRGDLRAIFAQCRPEVVYLHQPLDKHDTHVASFLRALEALRSLPREVRPPRVLGVEAWRSLEWLLATDLVALDASAHESLKRPLIEVFASQVVGGKRYDDAALGRRRANATFLDSHSTDEFSELSWALDLTPLADDDTLRVEDFTLAKIDRLRAEVAQRLARLT